MLLKKRPEFSVEGVVYQVDWEHFFAGMSIFIPCLNPAKAGEAIRKSAKVNQAKIISMVTVFEEIRGLRVWRI